MRKICGQKEAQKEMKNSAMSSRQHRNPVTRAVVAPHCGLIRKIAPQKVWIFRIIENRLAALRHHRRLLCEFGDDESV